MFRYSITKKLMFLYFLVAISSLSAMGLYSYFKIRSALIDKVYDELQLINIMKIRAAASCLNDSAIASGAIIPANITHGIHVNQTELPGDGRLFKQLQQILRNDDMDIIRHRHVRSLLITDDRMISEDSVAKSAGIDMVPVTQMDDRDSVLLYQGPGIRNNGAVCLGVIQKLKYHNASWRILSETDYDAALKPVVNLRNDMIFLSVLILILIVSIAEVISKMIIQPIRLLIRSADRIGKGQYKPVVRDYPDSEFGVLSRTIDRMSEQIEIKTAELLEREERLKHFYQATSEGILFYHNDRIVLANEAFEKMTGYAAEILKQKKLSGIIDRPLWEQENETDSASAPVECNAVKSGGQLIPVEIQRSRIDYKNVSMNVLVVRDITHRKAMEASLQKERQDRLIALFGGQEGERQRIARELHDSLGQRLVALKMKLESLNPDDRLSPLANDLKTQLHAAIEEVKIISNDLAPATLRISGLEAALNGLIKDIRPHAGVNMECSSHGHFENLSDKTRIFIYRIAQEALTNALKHSGAAHIRMHLTGTGDSLVLMIEDDGAGFEISDEIMKKGNGLYNMKERCTAMGGSFDLESAAGKGTTIRVKAPKANKEVTE